MLIKINDMTNDEFNMGKEQEVLDLSPWVVLNMNEIAKLIAYNLCNTEYELKQEFIDEDINDYLCYILGLKNRNKIEAYKKYMVQKNVL